MVVTVGGYKKGFWDNREAFKLLLEAV